MKLNFKQIFGGLAAGLTKHSPEILTGLGIIGMISAGVMAATATPKAMTLMEERKKEHETEKLGKTETVKTVWKCYIPAGITAAVSAACIIGASSVNLRRNAALAAAYTLSETAFNDYREQTLKAVGEKKEEEIQSLAAAESRKRCPVTDREVIVTDKGSCLCFDGASGRYFSSDIETVRRAVNTINAGIIGDPCGYASLNDFYYEIGLKSISVGERLGWHIGKELNVNFTSDITEDGRPCLVLGYRLYPLD
ncbi:MAG: DUF6353 family protein [Ruminococcus sp.]|nr:DUF6353 family protein [Ruminococcus sp.]